MSRHDDKTDPKQTVEAGGLDRRAFLKGTLAAGTLLLAGPLLSERAEAAEGDCGVASGDPTPDGAVIWTRVPDAYQSTGSIQVTWEVSTSPGFESGTIVKSGSVTTSSSQDFTLAVRVTGLKSFSWYYYRFQTSSGYRSVIGRTLTAPAPDAEPSAIRFAFISCQSFTAGYYNVLAAMAKDDIHYCLGLGDNIYEYGGTEVRSDPISRPTTADGYRAKYRHYLTDPHLREVRRLFPWIYIWDDHEVFNNFAGNGEVTTAERATQAAAYQAFREYMPLDPSIVLTIDPDGVPYLPIHRKFTFGQLAEVFATDQRQFRDGEVCRTDFATFGCDDMYAEDRTMLGEDQFLWLRSGLKASPSQWKVVMSSLVMMAFKISQSLLPYFDREVGGVFVRTNDGLLVNADQWDGFPAERASLLEFIRDERISNVVVLSGDVHNCWAGLLRPDFQKRRESPVAVELTTGSVTSDGLAESVGGRDLSGLVNQVMKPANPHIAWMDAKYHVYSKLEVTPDAAVATFVAVDTITQESFSTFPLAKFTIPNGVPQLVKWDETAVRASSRRQRR